MGIVDIDITQKDKEILTTLLKKYLPDTTIRAFGSRIKQTSHRGSDLDLVAFIKPEQKHQLYDLKEAFAESDLTFRVDIFNWEDLPDSFKENINKKYVVIQS